jgi:ACT domain-containing protein
VNTIELVKKSIPIDEAIKWFNISRATYHSYKILVINKCSTSYFDWCVKIYLQQLLKTEIVTIKKYFEKTDLKYWSKT